MLASKVKVLIMQKHPLEIYFYYITGLQSLMH